MGALLVLFSAACFGAMAVFGKLAFAAGVSTEAVLLVRFALSALLLIALAVHLRRRPTRGAQGAGDARRGLPPLRTALVALLGLGAIGYAAQAAFYFSALREMDAALVAIIFYTYPVLVTLAAAALGREALTPRRLAALGVATAGVLLVLIGSGGGRATLLGVVLSFACALTYTGYILVADRVVPHVEPVLLAALVMSGAALTTAVRATASGGVDLSFSATAWLWLACIAVVSTVVAMVAFFAGMHRTGPSSAAILSTFEPVVTTALAALVLRELPTTLQLTGGALVLAAVVVLQLRPRRRSRRGEGRADLLDAASASP